MTPRSDPNALAPHWREWYEERAAIREYMGKQPREVAEREAMNETIAAMETARAADGDEYPF